VSVTVSSKPKRSAVPTRVIFVIIAGIFAISSSAILIKSAQAEKIPSLVIAAGRLALSAIMLTPFVLSSYRFRLLPANTPRPHLDIPVDAIKDIALTRRDLALVVAAGILLALHFATWVTSLEYTSVLLSVVFVTTGPIWVAFLEMIWLRTPLARTVAYGLAIAILGGLIVGLGTAVMSSGVVDAAPMDKTIIGALLSLAGAVTFAGYMTIGRQLRAFMPILPYIWLVYGVAGIALLLAVFVSGLSMLGYSATGYLMLLGLAIFPQLIGHSSMNYAVGYLSATLVSMMAQLEPVGSAILAFIILGESPLPIQLIGSAVILIGVLVATLSPRSSSPSSESTAA
jgi:drug/metabolite transporter (DMT)-like permease